MGHHHPHLRSPPTKFDQIAKRSRSWTAWLACQHFHCSSQTDIPSGKCNVDELCVHGLSWELLAWARRTYYSKIKQRKRLSRRAWGSGCQEFGGGIHILGTRIDDCEQGCASTRGRWTEYEALEPQEGSWRSIKDLGRVENVRCWDFDFKVPIDFVQVQGPCLTHSKFTTSF